MSAKKLKEGGVAPDFSLPDQGGKEIKLSQFKNKKNVVLYFYPKDMTPGCTKEACSFTEHKTKFDRRDTVVLGVSFDSPARHQKFIEKEGLKIDLLADENKEVAKLYDVYQKKKFMGKEFMGIVRSTFVIDKQGKLRKIFSNVKVDGHTQEVLEAL